MSSNSGSNLYSQGFGTTSSSSFAGNAVVETRNPSSSDIRGNNGAFPIGQLWVNRISNESWQLTSYTASASEVVATWTALNGSSGIAIGKIGVEVSMAPGVNPVVPNGSGQVNFNSLQVPNGGASNGIVVGSVSPNDVTWAIQLSGTSATADATKNGISHFDSSSFSVDSDGFVTLVGGSSGISSLTPNSGTSPVVPSGGGVVAIQGTGSITTVGGTNSLTPQLTGLTNHNVLVGAGTATITNVAPSSTSGIPLVSNGASADPSFTTAVVAGGGTGATSFTAYSPLCGGTTTTAALQSASTGQATSGFVLTSTGASSLPTWQAPSGGSGITTINGNTGSVTGTTVSFNGINGTLNFSGSSILMEMSPEDSNENIGLGNSSLSSVTSGSHNMAFGASALHALSTGSNNVAIGVNAGAATDASELVAIGAGALAANTSGSQSVAIGASALLRQTTGSNNVAVGYLSGFSLTTQNDNTAIGNQSLQNAVGAKNTAVGSSALVGIGTGGQENTAIGYLAGSDYSSSDTNNISIGASVIGVSGESNAIRIGNNSNITCFIAGIRDITTGTADAIPVLIDSSGQLGTASSSIRHKTSIHDLEGTERIYDLRPVSFKYKKQESASLQFGLIAEEVAQVIPEIVVNNENGEIETVQYQVLPIFLLNEMKKLRDEVIELKKKLNLG